MKKSLSPNKELDFVEKQTLPGAIPSLYRGQVKKVRIENSDKILELKEGFGIRQFDDGSTYEGYWADNMPNGQGTFTYSNGEVYKGAFKNGSMHGKGDFKY